MKRTTIHRANKGKDENMAEDEKRRRRRRGGRRRRRSATRKKTKRKDLYLVFNAYDSHNKGEKPRLNRDTHRSRRKTRTKENEKKGKENESLKK